MYYACITAGTRPDWRHHVDGKSRAVMLASVISGTGVSRWARERYGEKKVQKNQSRYVQADSTSEEQNWFKNEGGPCQGVVKATTSTVSTGTTSLWGRCSILGCNSHLTRHKVVRYRSK
jgi:hypothetical protein